MKNILSLTHILFPVFIGMIIGGIIFNSTILGWGIFLLILDITVGICIQKSIDESSNSHSNKDFQKPIATKKSLHHGEDDDDTSCVSNEFYSIIQKAYRDDFLKIIKKLKSVGGARLIDDPSNDEAVEFLVSYCQILPCAPLSQSFANIYVVST